MEAKKIAVVALALLALSVAVDAQGCPAITTFLPCLNYVQQGSTAGQPAPGSSCCNLVTGLSQVCLCQAAQSQAANVDFNKAISLPKACGRAVPAGTTCNGVTVPSGVAN